MARIEHMPQPSASQRCGLLRWLVGLALVSVSLCLQPAETARHRAERVAKGEFGVVVDSVPEGVLSYAGLQPGDVVVGWRLLPGVGTMGETRGFFGSVFDWRWLERELAPRGLVELTVVRDQQDIELQVLPGEWKSSVRPHWSREVTRLYEAGRALIERGALDPGIDRWREAMTLVGSVRTPDIDSWLWLQIGDIQTAAERWHQALLAYEAALEATTKPLVRAEVWGSLGAFHASRSQRFIPTSEAYREGSEIWRQYREYRELFARSHIAGLPCDAELTAQLHSESAARRRSTVGPVASIAFGHVFSLAATIVHRVELERAATSFEQAVEAYPWSPYGSLGRARWLNAQGDLAFGRRQIVSALESFQNAEAIVALEAPYSLVRSRSAEGLGRVAWARGDHQTRNQHFGRLYWAKARRIPQDMRRPHRLNTLAGDAWDNGSMADSARLRLQAFEELYPFIAEGNFRWALWPPRARLQLLEEFMSLHTFHERVVRQVRDRELQGALRADFAGLAGEMIGAMVRAGDAPFAYQLLAASRSNRFLQSLADRKVLRSTTAEELTGCLQTINAQYDRWQSVPAGKTGDRRTQRAALEMHRLRAERGDVLDAMTLAASAYGVRGSLREPEDRPRAGSDRGTLLLFYSVFEKETYLFVFGHGDRQPEVEILELGRAELRRHTRAWLAQLSRAPLDTAPGPTDIGRRLYDLLIDPIAERVNCSRRLVIMADGPLHHLPWGALGRSASHGSDRAGQYLAEWKPVHHATSALSYGRLLDRRRTSSVSDSRTLDWVAFGDPIYRDGPFGTVRGRSSTGRGLLSGWPSLPFTRVEVDGIARLFSSAPSKTLLGDAATEGTVDVLASEARILHLATHTHLDEDYPLDSGVVLTIPEQRDDGEHNGLLQAWEIIERLRVNADLVVLSSCGSAAGREYTAEGIESLARAFLIAGARSVLASLWPVDDRATAALMMRFYRHLTAGVSQDEALRRAQMELIRGPVEIEGSTKRWDFSHPYYWAAFQVYGDWR